MLASSQKSMMFNGSTNFHSLVDFNVQQDISNCQKALQQQDIHKVSQISLRLLGRARRVTMVATADPMYKGNLQTACGQLESGTV